MIACTALVASLKAMTVAAVVTVTGLCPPAVYIHTAPVGTVLDVTGATMLRLDLDGVSGFTVRGFTSTGAATSALNVIGSTRTTLIGPHCINPGTTCIGITLSDQTEVAAPWVTGSRGDGIDAAGSTNTWIHDGACEGNVVTALHPDCVQFWSLPGHPMMHATVQRMTAIGATQGYDLWDHTDLGATDIKFLDNVAAIYGNANCIGVLNVHGFVAQGNRCITLPGGPITTGPARISARPLNDAVITGNEPP